MDVKPVLYVALVWSLIYIRVSGQSFHSGAELAYVHTFTVEDGLSQSDVNTVLKDRYGFIWIGTDKGLNRFDGYTFKVFHHERNDSTSLGNDKVNDLLEDSEGRLWIATTTGGLNLFDRSTETFSRFKNNPLQKNSLSQNTVQCILEDSHQNIWVGTYKGLNLFNPDTETFTRFYRETGDNRLAGNNINCLIEDHAGNIWVGTEGGVSIIEKSSRKIINYSTTPDGIKLSNVLTLLEQEAGKVWIGTDGQGAWMLNTAAGTFQQYMHHPDNPTGMSGNLVRKIISDKKGNLFFGTDGGGITILEKNKNVFRNLVSNNDPTLFNAAIYELYIDNENLLWIGTYGGGLKIINNNERSFVHYEVFDSTMMRFGRKNSVLAIVEDGNKNIWIGTDGAGLYRFNPFTREFTSYTHDPKIKNTLSSNVIKSLLVDHKGNIYAGTFGGGLNYINLKTGTITRYMVDENNPHGICSNHVWSLVEDSNSTIWVGTLGGLDRFDPQKKIFRHFKSSIDDSTTISSDLIFKIYEDRNKNIWFGTRNDGLNKLIDEAAGTFKRYRQDDGLNSDEIRDLIEDRNGTLWVATISGGLNYYRPEDSSFHSFEKKNSQRPEDILSILEDDVGNFWMGTFYGLIRYNPVTGESRKYTVGDGLQGNEFNYNAKLKSSTGDFYLGGLNGISIFHPSNIKENTTLPPIVLTKILLFHKEVTVADDTGILQEPVTFQKKLVLQPGQNVITIEYAALSYHFPRSNEYSYILEGFDKEWNYVGTQHAATYTNLPPGNYTFRVVGTNDDGLWNEQGATLTIHVMPPWYQIRSIQGLMAAAFIGLLGAFVRVRTKMIVRQKQKLELLVQERTHELEKINAEIRKINSKITQQNEELKSRNEEIISQREEIEEKSIMLEKAHEEIQTVNEELVKVNSNLERLVELRTSELRQAMQKLIETDEGLNLFLYRSSHDLRGPITTLQGLAVLMKLENRQKELDHYFDKISLSCEHMLKLLKKLNETNVVFRTSITVAKVDWDKIFADTRFELSKLDPRREVDVIIENHINEDTYSDEHLLSNIIQNLMENAAIFKSRENAYVRLTLHKSDQHVTIKVEDNGIGIGEDIKDKVFEMFYRGSERSVGNGLGLFLVKKSAELLNGKIEISSKVSNYTQVTVTIPLHQCPTKN